MTDREKLIGILAGAAADGYSLGTRIETERLVDRLLSHGVTVGGEKPKENMGSTQIDEMVKIVEEAFLEDYNLGCDPCSGTVVEHLISAGWRKQTEGEWITLEPSIGLFTCSLCDHRILRAKCNYCPNCGAKMKGGAE